MTSLMVATMFFPLFWKGVVNKWRHAILEQFDPPLSRANDVTA